MMDWIFSVQHEGALLPPLAWQQGWLMTGWSIVLAWIGVWLVSLWTHRALTLWVAAASMAGWVVLPGPWGAGYALGLAFQAPSITTVLLCALLLVRRLVRSSPNPPLNRVWPVELRVFAGCGMALGWVLLFDTLGVFPGSLYNWGFGAAAPACLVTALAMGWAVAKPAFSQPLTALWAVALLVFLAVRLPSGNVFDALLDPGLWLVLQITWARQWAKKNLHGLHRAG